MTPGGGVPSLLPGPAGPQAREGPHLPRAAMMRRISIAVFLLALVSLATEILLTRIFDVLLWHNLSFMVISCAVFGLALGGLRDFVAPPPSPTLAPPALHRLPPPLPP